MSGTTGLTNGLLQRLRAGDGSARDALVTHAYDRLRHLARRMLRGYPGVGRWEEEDDVLHNALVRLCRALDARIPESVLHFYNLGALQIRRELLDLTERHQGRHGVGANHHTDPTGGALAGATDSGGEPSSIVEWGDFHRAVESLPDDEREVFGLVWYQGLTQDEASEVLRVSIRTVKRRWQSARLALAAMKSGKPIT